MFTLRKKKLSGNDLTDLAINIKFLFSSYVRLSVHTTEQKNLKYLDLLIHSKFKGRPLKIQLASQKVLKMILLKFSVSEKATKICAIVLKVLTSKPLKDDCSNFCGLLIKAELYKMRQ